MSSSATDDLLQAGQLVKERWKVVSEQFFYPSTIPARVKQYLIFGFEKAYICCLFQNQKLNIASFQLQNSELFNLNLNLCLATAITTSSD